MEQPHTESTSKRPLWAGVCGVFLAVAALAGAQGAAAETVLPTSDIARFRIPMTPDGLLATEGPNVLPAWYASGTAMLHYARHPLTWRYTDDNSFEPIITNRLMLELGAAVGILGYVDVGVAMPFALLQQGPRINGLGLQLSSLELGGGNAPDPNMSGAGVGDLRLLARLGLLKERKWGFGLAAVSEFSLPTGDNERFLGERTVAWRGRLVGSVPLYPLRVIGSLGLRLRKKSHIADVQIGQEVDFRAGALLALAVSDVSVDAIVELVGSAPASKRTAGQLATELLAGLRARFFDDYLISVGAGAGLTTGVGTPAFRVLFGVAYSPELRDTDRDGIPDSSDDCPEHAEDLDQFADDDGCPDTDNDGDGIVDNEDWCPDLAEDFNAIDDDDGCPDADRDGDGIRDVEDQCPDEPERYNAVDDDDGCPDKATTDRDGDKLLDEDDRCPDEPEDVDGFKDGDGCPDWDNDEDGIPDELDDCREVPETLNGVQDEDGCPDQGRASLADKGIELEEAILFETGSATIKAESMSLLDEVAATILAHPKIKMVTIEGHTDSIGPEEDNLFLSQDRADSVRMQLIKRGVPRQRLRAIGYGETRPIDTNETPTGRARNRRVKFVTETDTSSGDFDFGQREEQSQEGQSGFDFTGEGFNP